MPLLEGGTIQCELLQDRSAFDMIPSIGEQNAAHVPKNCADLDHWLRLRVPGKVWTTIPKRTLNLPKRRWDENVPSEMLCSPAQKMHRVLSISGLCGYAS